jgi:hypothetical protein
LRSEPTEIDDRQKPGFAGLLFFCDAGAGLREPENQFQHARILLHFGLTLKGRL